MTPYAKMQMFACYALPLGELKICMIKEKAEDHQEIEATLNYTLSQF
jgi:hypothetical protein